MKQYTQLNQEQRYQISALKGTNKSQSEIARIIGCDKSTISRGLKCNTGRRGYRPDQAQKFRNNRKANNANNITEFGWAYIIHLLTKKYSPEQITGRLRKLGWKNVPSHEAIYKYI